MIIIIIIIGVYCRRNAHIIAQKHAQKNNNKETNTQTAYAK